ncbi:MAG: hypothetical protein HY896_05665 [Deltaproteobacteria bacterium]|nr:hypothetical protein [Deltaproteobacteria bacterium]
MKRAGKFTKTALAVTIAILLIGCGGGGGGGESGQGTTSPGSSAPSLAWDPPTTFSDNSVMDPYADLDYYELYLRSDEQFSDSDVAVAQVSAVTNVLGPDGRTYLPSLTNAFNLNNLAPFTQSGTVYFLSIKSVGVDGLRSGFSTPVMWSRT